MKARAAPRWAVSFADLCLLLLGFFVLLQARPDAGKLADGLQSALGARKVAALDIRARDWFEPGEAVLLPEARRRLRAFANGAHGVTITTRGTEAQAPRFDGWELAAARAAAIARAVAASGVAERDVALRVDPATGGGQTLRLSRD